MNYFARSYSAFVVLLSLLVPGEAWVSGVTELGQKAPQVCTPSYISLEESAEFRTPQAARKSLALIGCEEELRLATTQQLRQLERDFLARAERYQWSQREDLAKTERSWARARAAIILGKPVEVEIFYFFSR